MSDDYDIYAHEFEELLGPNPEFWTNQFGDRIAIKDMETSHLVNAIHMLLRRGFWPKELLDFIGDCEIPEQGFEALRELHGFDRKFPSIHIYPMLEELKKR